MRNMDIDKRKRNRMIRVIFVDIIMSLAVVALVFVLVAIVEGWRLSSNLKLEQNGMAQIESLPTGAKVIIDGRQDFNETNISKLLPAGEHEITLKKDGYDSWSKKINIVSGLLTRLRNPRLFKQNRKTEVVENYNNLRFVYAAPDHRSILLASDQTTKWKYVTALGSDKVSIEEIDVKKIFSGTFDGQFPGEILQISWNETGEKILLQVKRSDQIEWGLINLRKPSESINLSQAILKYTDRSEKNIIGGENKKSNVKRDLSDLVIEDAAANKFIALIDGNLQEVDAANKTLSEPYLKNIAKFKMSGSEIIYLTNVEKDKRQIGIYRLGDKGGIDLETVVRSKKDAVINLGIVDFDGKKYLSTTVDGQFRVYRTNDYPTYGSSDNMPEKITEEKLDFVPQNFITSSNGEFFIAETDGKFMIYNLDLEELSLVEHKNKRVAWLDNYMMFDIVDGKMKVFDFDGGNRRTILNKGLVTGFDAVINSNNRYLYYITKTDTGYSLQRDKLF